jgi:hypothetical protein
MGSLTNYGETHLLDYLLGKQDTVPATWYLALFTASPGETGSLAAEATNYARLAITNNLANWPAAASGAPSTKSNGADLTMAAASGATGLVTHAGLVDAAGLGAGNCWVYFDLTCHSSRRRS